MGNTDALSAACIKFAQAGGYAYKPFSFTIANNYFNYSRYAHFIQADNVKSLAITGNHFHLAGMYNANTYDDINLSAVDYAVVVGNTSAAVINNYDPGAGLVPPNRSTRYCLTVGATCTNVKAGPNSFEAGLSGTVNDLSGAADIIGGTAGGFTTAHLWTTGGTNDDVTDPAIRVANRKVMTFLDAAGGPTNAAYTFLDASNHLRTWLAGALRTTLYNSGPFGVPQLNTTERNALTPAVGMVIYNLTDNKFQGYTGTWDNL
jgi:hypothetical protein